MKVLSDTLSMTQAVFLRGLLMTVLLALLAWRIGALGYRPARRDGRLIGLRIAAEIAGTVCFLLALFHLPIANASAILQSLPLAVTLAAALFLGEPVGWRRYLAIGVGFLGVLIIVRPGSEGFDAWSLWAVAAILCIVTRDLATRCLSPAAPALGVALVTSVALTAAAGLAGTGEDWNPLGPAEAVVFLAAALSLIAGYVFGVMAMRTGEIGFVQPFRYTLLIWAMLYGLLIFDEVSDAATLVGSTIVFATGLFTLWRERAARRPLASASTAARRAA